MKLDIIKTGIQQAIADADLPLGELSIQVERVGNQIVARLTERCAHGAVEETVERETEWERIDDTFQRSEAVGVRPLGRMEVFLWLLPKWLRWRKPRFTRITRQTHVTNAWRKDVTVKRVTYLPRPDLRTRPCSITSRMTPGTADMLDQAMKQTSPMFQDVPSPLASIPIHVSKHVPDDQVLIVSPKSFSLIRNLLP